MASGLRPQRSTTEVFVHEGIGSGTVLKMSAVAWNQRREDNHAEREGRRQPRPGSQTGIARCQEGRPAESGWGRRVTHVPSLWGHYRKLPLQFHPPEKAALRCMEMAVDEEDKQRPPAAARTGLGAVPRGLSADKPSGFCHLSHQEPHSQRGHLKIPLIFTPRLEQLFPREDSRWPTSWENVREIRRMQIATTASCHLPCVRMALIRETGSHGC